MSDKKTTISEALAEVQRKVNEQRLAQITKMYNEIEEANEWKGVGEIARGAGVGISAEAKAGIKAERAARKGAKKPAEPTADAPKPTENPAGETVAKKPGNENPSTSPVEKDIFGQPMKDGKITEPPKAKSDPIDVVTPPSAKKAPEPAAGANDKFMPPASGSSGKSPNSWLKRPATKPVNKTSATPPTPPTTPPSGGSGGSTPPSSGGGSSTLKKVGTAAALAAVPAAVVGGAIVADKAKNDSQSPAASASPAPAAPAAGGTPRTPPRATPTPPAATPKPPKPAAAAPKAADAEPEDKHAKSKAMFSAATGDNDTPGNFFAADAQRQKELGKKAPNDFSDSAVGRAAKSIEDSSANKWMNKTFGSKDKDKPVSESNLIGAFLKLQETKHSNIFEAAKKAKKDWDKDGKIESEKDEVWGSRFAAAKKAGKMEEAATSSDPDFAAPRPDGSKKPDDIQYKPEDKKPEDKKVPLPPKRPTNEETDPGFSEEELAHFASIMEANPVSKVDPEFSKSNSNAGKVPARDLTDETIEEARGRPKKNAEPAPGEESGRDPRQHIQVIAGQAAAGRVIDFKHNNGDVSKISPGMGRSIVNKLGNLKPAERHAAVNKMHDSAEGLKG